MPGPPPSSCGLSKRYLFDSAAVEGGYDVVVTGHNLDDEAAVLYGNVLTWQTDYLSRQLPVLPARDGFPRKVKPLVRLTEREMAAYCVITGIDYMIDECPMAVGNKHIAYKEALNAIEEQSPGSKFTFYHGFLARAQEQFAAACGDGTDDRPGLRSCTRCGSPSSNEVCAFCALTDKVAGREPVPVELIRPRR